MTKSTPFGSLDHPFNPIALALGAEATLRRAPWTRPRAPGRRAARRHRAPGRGLRRDLPELQRVQRRRLRRGAGKGKEENQIRLEHGKPIRFGAEGERAWSAAPTAAWGSRTSPRWGDGGAAGPRRPRPRPEPRLLARAPQPSARTARLRSGSSASSTARATARAREGARGRPGGRGRGRARLAVSLRRHLDGRVALLVCSLLRLLPDPG